MPKIVKNGKEYSGVPIEVVTAWQPTGDPVQVAEPLMGNTDISDIGDGTITGAISSLSAGLTYSTSEKRVGTWTDGKPLYSKIIVVNSLPNATATIYNHNIANVDKIWCDVSNTFIDWTTHTAPIPYVGGGTSLNAMIEIRQFNSTSFQIDTHSTDRTSIKAVISVRYTKTTD